MERLFLQPDPSPLFAQLVRPKIQFEPAETE
jgi:hypothetical protein